MGCPVVSLLYHGTNGRDGHLDSDHHGGLVGCPVVSLLYHGTNGPDGHLDSGHQWGTGGISRGVPTVPWDQWTGRTLEQWPPVGDW